MSGGVDSSMSAILLQEQGYEVIGVTFNIIGDYLSLDCPKKQTSCCNLDALNDAKNIAKEFGFQHYVVDVHEQFEQIVIKNFIDEYLSGRTPNPCVICNPLIKWNTLLKEADKHNCEFIATGHYAQIRKENNRFILCKALDEEKDQSYMLWALTQEHLKRTIFPLGMYRKKEIKTLAKKYNYLNKVIVKKRESQEICFIPDNDYRKFLRDKIKDIDEKIGKGDIILSDEKIVGKHNGYPFYTISQRKGLNIATGTPLYVTKIIPETNTIVVGTIDELMKKETVVKNINFIKYSTFFTPMEVITKVRYASKGAKSTIKLENDRIYVHFHEPAFGVTPGQSAVFYQGDDVVGGGIIDNCPCP